MLLFCVSKSICASKLMHSLEFCVSRIRISASWMQWHALDTMLQPALIDTWDRLLIHFIPTMQLLNSAFNLLSSVNQWFQRQLNSKCSWHKLKNKRVTFVIVILFIQTSNQVGILDIFQTIGVMLNLKLIIIWEMIVYSVSLFINKLVYYLFSSVFLFILFTLFFIHLPWFEIHLWVPLFLVCHFII